MPRHTERLSTLELAISTLNGRIAVLEGSPPPDPGGGSLNVISYTYDNSIFENPGRGRQESYESDAGINGGSGTLAAEGISSFPHRVARRYWYCPTADAALPTSFLNGFDADVDAAVAAGKLLDGRFAYFGDPNDQQLSYSRISGHINQLLPRINARAYAFHTLELGWFGPWGQFHSINSAGWTDGERNQPQPQTLEIVQRVMNNTPSTLWVTFPYPEVMIWMEGQLSAPHFARLGCYNDGFMTSDEGGDVAFDNGTFPGAWTDGLDIPRREWAHNFAMSHAWRAESDTDNPGVDDHFAQEGDNCIYYGLQRQHIDTLRDWWLTPNVLDPKGFTDRFMREMGYRLFMRRSRIPTSGVNNTTFTFDVEFENMGVAPPRRDYIAKVKFGSNGNTASPGWVTATMNSVNLDSNGLPTTTGAATNPKAWIGWQSPAVPVTRKWVRFTCTIPSGLAGNQPIALAFIDPNTQLQSNGAYNVRMANSGVWDATNSRNNLLATVAIS
jgi:hypothetical protein